MRNYQLVKVVLIGSVIAAQQVVLIVSCCLRVPKTFKCGSRFYLQLVAFGSGCVNGKWEEDTCVCNEGYETVPSVTTEPSYCTKRSVVVIHIVNASPWNHREVLDLVLPIVSY